MRRRIGIGWTCLLSGARRPRCFLSWLFIALATVVFLVPQASRAASRGDAVDVVPFGEVTRWDAQGRDYGVIWEDSRDIFRVTVRFAGGAESFDSDHVRLEYWRSAWPQHRIPRDQPSGAGSSGWLNVGDWFQGRWQKADTIVQRNGDACTFTFNPVNASEFPKLKDFAAPYRSALKLRLVADTPLPEIAAFYAYTDSTWTPLQFVVQWGGTANDRTQCWDGRLEVFNGIIERVEPVTADSRVQIQNDVAWKSTVRKATDGVRACILYAQPKGYNSFDETIVTVRTARETFSFAASDLVQHDHMFLPDFGVLVRRIGSDVTYDSAFARWRENREKNIYARVATVPEQTLTGAWRDVPAKQPHYIPLGFDGGRQYFGLEADGSVFCRYGWLARIPGKDTQRCLYDGNRIRYGFGLSDAQLVERSLVEGRLPMMVARWRRDGVQYRQSVFVVPFDGVPEEGRAIDADDTLVLMARFEMSRAGDAVESQAGLDMQVVTTAPEKLAVEDGFVYVADTDPKRLRLLVTSPDAASTYTLDERDGRVVYRAALTAAQPTRVVDVAIPYITLTDATAWAKLRTIGFESASDSIRRYWSTVLRQGTEIVTPEPMINDFYQAHLSHLLLNTDREVGTSNRRVARVGTFSYGAFSNESCMMVSDLDRRGYHQQAEEALETWLHHQGEVGLPGDFSTKDGQFYGAGGYEDGGYNQHHGFVLWCLGEHYWYTRDAEWLKRSAPKIVKGCDWIINERKRTIITAETSGVRAIERGLLPAGCLEDIKDWRFWLSTNVYSWWGMQNAGAALADAGLPDGKRILKASAAYREDILRAFTEAMQRSPVVRLRDGSWIPHIPPEVHRRGRTFGWLTETLEGAIHMIRTGLTEPWDRTATWIIKDFEDNLYISEQYGYNITGADFERYWFSRGGISMQANLLCNPIPYLLRDEPEHFLRAYFNGFAVSYWPDTRMMTEHALPNIGDWRGDHYKSSDEANSTYWLRLMFVQERGDELWLGAAGPCRCVGNRTSMPAASK